MNLQGTPQHGAVQHVPALVEQHENNLGSNAVIENRFMTMNLQGTTPYAAVHVEQHLQHKMGVNAVGQVEGGMIRKHAAPIAGEAQQSVRERGGDDPGKEGHAPGGETRGNGHMQALRGDGRGMGDMHGQAITGIHGSVSGDQAEGSMVIDSRDSRGDKDRTMSPRYSLADGDPGGNGRVERWSGRKQKTSGWERTRQPYERRGGGELWNKRQRRDPEQINSSPFQRGAGTDRRFTRHNEGREKRKVVEETPPRGRHRERRPRRKRHRSAKELGISFPKPPSQYERPGPLLDEWEPELVKRFRGGTVVANDVNMFKRVFER